MRWSFQLPLGNSFLSSKYYDTVGKDAGQYKNTVDCFVKIYQQEGLRGYYKGVIPRMGRVVPGQGVIFMSFESIQEAVEKYLIKPSSK